VVFLGEDQLRRRVEEEPAEHEQHPAEALDQRHPGEDEQGPHHEGAEDAPEQHAVLVLLRDQEVAHDQGPDEDVVDAEALLDQVARDVLPARRRAEPPRHDAGERQSAADPGGGFVRRLARAHLVRVTMHHQQIDQQQRGDDPEQHQPVPRLDVQLDEVVPGRFGGDESPVHRATLRRRHAPRTRTCYVGV
jgi:hypothetical protein